MKRLILLQILISALLSVNAQVPQGFNYQAIARDASGNPISNTNLPVTITIQSDSLGGTIFWEELHAAVMTNSFGVFTLIIGDGARQASSTFATFGDINWSVTPKYIKTQIFYSSTLLNMGSSRFWSVPYAVTAGDLAGPIDKLEVVGTTDSQEEALFEVRNKLGKTVFAVYNDGVRIYVDDGTKKGTKGGFAIGGFGTEKAAGKEYFRVTSDSVRVYIDPVSGKGQKGGFAIGGFTAGKSGTDEEYLRVTTDSVKVSKSLLIPRLTTTERDNLPFIPGEALIIFNMTEGCMQIYKNNVWSNIWCFNCAPAFIIQPIDKTICSGESATFFVSVTGTNLIYKWQVSTNGGSTWSDLSNGGTNPVYSGTSSYSMTLSNVPVSNNSYIYRCTVSGTCPPNIISNNVTLNVGSTPPVITSNPADKVLSTGCGASFSITSPGYGVTYQWQQSINGGSTWNNISNGGSSPVFTGATTATLSLTNVPWASNNYKYRCIAGNLCGTSATSGAATLTISPVSIVTQPVGQQLSAGCAATFSVVPPAGYAVTYQWQVSSNGGSTWTNVSNGGTSPVYSGATSSSLSLTTVPLACNNFQYRCILSSLCGPNETSTAATLTINLSPVITTQPINNMVYAGENLSFNISAAGSGNLYRWQVSTNGGTVWANVSDGGTSPVYSGTTSTVLSLANIPVSCNNYKYRCVVSHACQWSVNSDPATMTIQSAVSVTDIDGNTYATVGIGSQLWMAANLKTTKYRNGDLIGTTTPAGLNITGEATPKYQWGPGGSEANVATYGRLYTGYAVTDSRNVCPTGWHVPTDAEVTALIAYVGGGDANAGGNLKETGTAHWNSPNTGATNNHGFTALPSGYRDMNGIFYRLNTDFYWYTSTDVSSTTQEYHIVAYSQATIWHVTVNKKFGMAVRCVKD